MGNNKVKDEEGVKICPAVGARWWKPLTRAIAGEDLPAAFPPWARRPLAYNIDRKDLQNHRPRDKLIADVSVDLVTTLTSAVLRFCEQHGRVREVS